MKSAIVLAAVCVLGGCATEPPVPVPDIVGQAANACLPEAIIMAETFHKEGIPARILIVNTTSYSHAAVAFLYPANAPQLWVWDSTTRSVQLKANFNDPIGIARAWLDAIIRDETLVSASFL